MGKGILAAFITLVVGLLTMSVFTGAEEVGQGADALDLGFEPVAFADQADPGRGAGEDHIAGQQGHCF